MIIGIIGDFCSGKRLFADIIKEYDNSIQTLYSCDNELKKVSEVKDNSQFPEHNLEKYIDLNQPWLVNHKHITNLLENSTIDEEKIAEKLKSNNIREKIRNQSCTTFILGLTEHDFNILMNKSTFRLIRIHSIVKRRYENYLIRTQNNKDESSFDNFLKLDEEHSNRYKLHKFNSTITYNIVNKKSLEDFRQNILMFWNEVNRKFRPEWDDYFMKVALHVADRASCVKTKVGAVIVKDKRIVSTGFNGTPVGLPNCQDGYCPRCHKNYKQGEGFESCFCIHAEENSIIEVGREKCKGSTIYVTFSPCLHCSKLIIQSGIKEVVYLNQYNAEFSFTILEQAGIKVSKYSEDSFVFDS